MFRFEAGRRCIGYAGTFEFFSDQYTNIPKVIRECVNRHKCGLSNHGSNTPPSHTPVTQGNSLEKEKTRVVDKPPEKEHVRPLSFADNGESLYSQVDDAKKQQQSISPNSIAMMSNRITTLEHVMKTNQPSTVPTLPNRTGDEDLYQEPLLSEDEYDPAIVKRAENFTITPSGGGAQHTGARASIKSGRILAPDDYYEELHNATSGIPSSLRSGDTTTPVNGSSAPSSEDESAGLYSNIDISADHGSGTIIRTKWSDRATSNGDVNANSASDADSDQVAENIYDSTPVNDEELPPEPPTRRTSFQPANFVTPADFPRAPFPCNIPRPPGLLQMLNVPRHHNIKSNLQPRHFGDSYS